MTLLSTVGTNDERGVGRGGGGGWTVANDDQSLTECKPASSKYHLTFLRPALKDMMHCPSPYGLLLNYRNPARHFQMT